MWLNALGTALLVIWSARLVYRYMTFWRHLYKIPGPTAIPLIGNIFKKFLTPQQLFKRQREYAKQFKDLYTLYAPTIGVITMHNPDDIEQVLTNNIHNSKSVIYDVLHSWLGTGLLTSNGSKWQARRKILTPAFHFSILQEFVHIFNRETKHLVQRLEEDCSKPYIDVVPPITEFTLSSIAETSMGVSLSESSQENSVYRHAIYDVGLIFMQRLTKIWLFIPALYRMSCTKKEEDKIVKVLHNMSRTVIEQRKKLFNEGKLTVTPNSYSTKKRMAMLDLLLKAQQEGSRIDDEGLREEVDTFMFEGHDTTSVALCYVLMVLASHGDVQERILDEIRGVIGEDPNTLPLYNDFQEMKYLERCLKECLRLYPSVPLMARIAGQSYTTTTGYFVPKGTMIDISIYDLHRQENLYENSEKFDPDRFLPENCASRHPFAYIPFSAGSRNCIGQKFAILELKAAVCGILRKFVLEPVDTEETITFKADLVLRPDNKIKVKFVPRH